MKKKRIRYDGAAPLPILLYLLSVCTALMYAVCRKEFLPCTLIMCALTAGIFLLFYKFRSHPVVTTLVLFGMTIAAWAVGAIAGAYSTEDNSMMSFLFTASAQFDPLYAAAVIIIFSVVIGFIGYYFSVTSPRPCFLMLLTFIPLILSFRTARELPVYFTLIMAGCFIFACCNLSVPVQSEGSAVFEDRSSRRRRLAISGAAAVIIGLVCSVIPRPESSPIFDTLDQLVPQNHGYFSGAGLSNFASRSSVNTGNNSPRGDLLFTVRTDTPGYLKRWAFDTYNDDGWRADKYNTGHLGWQYSVKASDNTVFLSTLLSNKDELMQEHIDLLDGITVPYPSGGSTMISIRDGSRTSVIIHPTGTNYVMLPESCGYAYRTSRDDIFTESAMPENVTYYLSSNTSYHNEDFMRRINGPIDMDLLISDAYYSDIISANEYTALTEDLQNASTYYSRCGTFGISDELQALADEITAGCYSDYDKARALETWFRDAGFVYDMDFVPAETGVDYFLFKSRRGICSDFATALTLLARAAGLPARYCEGYVLSNDIYDPVSDLYSVTDAQAHAWPQIYISGGGWLDFDATVYATPADDGEGSLGVFLYIAAGTAVLALLIFIFRKPLGRLMFTISYPFRSRRSRARGVYLRTRRLAAELSGSDERGLSAGEVRRILTDRLSMPAEADRICRAADEMFYSPEKTDPPGGLLHSLRALERRRRRLR